jgi:hypothetical protein
MQYLGALKKMNNFHSKPVRYVLDTADDLVSMNGLLGKRIGLTFKNKFICFCGMEVEKLYRSNFCYSCYFKLPQAGDAVFRPELSKAHLGIADRDLEFESKYQLQPHTVYLALSGGLKVGVTRSVQKDTRWMDQGATRTIVFAETPNRYLAGMIEVELKNFVSDKTNWQRMLTNQEEDIELVSKKLDLASRLPAELGNYVSQDHMVYEFEYPVQQYPVKVTSLNLLKYPSISGELIGIRGQYLLFDQGRVFNVRSHEGWVVEWEI